MPAFGVSGDKSTLFLISLQKSNKSMSEDIELFADHHRFRQNPVRFVNDFRKAITGHENAAYDGYIGAPLYEKPDWAGNIRRQTMKQPVVQECVAGLIEQQIAKDQQQGPMSAKQIAARRKECKQQLYRNLDRIALKALPTFSRKSAVRFNYFFVTQTLSRVYMQGMHVSQDQVDRLKAKAAECIAKKQSLVLFPCHKSHVDYIALVFAFFRLGLSLPMTIAGDNLDIPMLSWFLRQVGATFIRRGNWKDDPLYTAFFQGLINTYLQNGLNVQCFIEGTRSRTGKLLPPKYGLLKFICEAVTSGATDDCWIVPVSTQYDKVVEADTYATELLGKEKKSENLKSFLDSRSFLKVNRGRIDVRIGEGFSLKQFMLDQASSHQLKSVNALNPVQRTLALRAVAYRVLADINRVSVVMPSALVGTVLLTTRQRGLNRDDLVYRVRRLIDRVVERGGRIGTIVKPESELNTAEISLMVSKAIEVLGTDLVTVETKRLLEPVCFAKDEFKLSYYRNQVIHLFVHEAIVCTCLYQHFTQHLQLEVKFSKLKRQVIFLSRLFSGEFVFNSSDEDITEALQTCLVALKKQNIITSFDLETVLINEEEVRKGWVYTHFYTYLIWPYIDGYWGAAVSLQLLPQNVPVKVKSFLDVAQKVANTLYQEGALTHIEACNREVILSAVTQADARKLVSRDKNTVTRLASLEDLNKLCIEISLYRNEVMKRPADSELLLRVEQLARPLVEVKARL